MLVTNIRLNDFKAKRYLFQANDCATLKTIHYIKKIFKVDMRLHEKHVKDLEEQGNHRFKLLV